MTASKSFDTPVISYHGMRMRWCRWAVLGFLRRWGVYVLTGAVILGGASTNSGAVDVLEGISAWTVLPLFYAAAHPSWLPLAGPAQVLLTLLLLWGARTLLWSPVWREVESSLPLNPLSLRRSDTQVVAMVLLPIWATFAFGALTLSRRSLPWLVGAKALALATLGGVMALTLVLGVVMVRLMRGGGRRRVHAVASLHDTEALAPQRPGQARWFEGAAAVVPCRHVVWALLWMPLWRGPAQRLGRGLLIALLVLCGPAWGLSTWPGAAGWFLAAYALMSLVLVTRLQSLAALILDPLWRSASMLPVRWRLLTWCWHLLLLSVILPGGAGLWWCLPWREVRPAVWAAYGLVCVVNAALQLRPCGRGAVVSTVPNDAEKSSDASSVAWWLFLLVVSVALASEVVS